MAPFTALSLATLLIGADPVGQRIPDFSLPDTTGQLRSLGEFKDAKAFVIVFIGTECPVNNASLPKLVDLRSAYDPKGIRFLAVNANSHDAVDRIAQHAKQHRLTFPVLRDADAKVADSLGARRTPEVFLLDAERRLRYRGRIDDQFGVGYERPKPNRRDLAEALDELLAGKPISQPVIEMSGCYIARTAKPRGQGNVTYAKHVAAILQNRCQLCHRPGQVGPMPLLTYANAVAWSETIREVVSDGRMPPWHADPAIGKFSNDRSLSASDRATLLAWIDQGCPKGDDTDLPAQPTFPSDWTIGKPNLIVDMPEEVKIPALAPGVGLPYRYYAVKLKLDEDKWVQAAEARPGNRAIVHHIIAYVKQANLLDRNREDRIGDGWLTAYAPGDLGSSFAPGLAKRVPKDGILVFQMHYTPNGTEQTDRSSVGIIFAKEPPKHEVRTRSIGQRRFTIPPGADNHLVESSSQFPRDAVLFSMLPHMHLRGKSFEYRVVYPDGHTEKLLSVPRYDFHWQSVYRLAKPLPLPAGSRIECRAYFDNSEKNPNNPDPKKAVTWGDQTWQEMMIGFIDYAYTSDAAK
jgi:peroxiredoxin